LLKFKDDEIKKEFKSTFFEDLNQISLILGSNQYVQHLFIFILIPIFYERIEFLFKNEDCDELYKYYGNCTFFSSISNQNVSETIVKKILPNIKKVSLSIPKNDEEARKICNDIIKNLDLFMVILFIFPLHDIQDLEDKICFLKDDISEGVTLDREYLLEFSQKFISYSLIHSLSVVSRNLIFKCKGGVVVSFVNKIIFKLQKSIEILLVQLVKKISARIEKSLSIQRKSDFIFSGELNPLADSSKTSHQLIDELKITEKSYENISFSTRKFLFISFFLNFFFLYLNHIKKFTFSNLNSLILLKELNFFQKEFELISRYYDFRDKIYWEFINSLVGIFTSNPESLKTVINEGILSNFDKTLYQQFISLRDDLKTFDPSLYRL
jgi:hypothetical protein